VRGAGHHKAFGQAGHHREPRYAERVTRRPSATPGITGSQGARSGSPEGHRPRRASQGARVRGAGHQKALGQAGHHREPILLPYQVV
jgi:hypothetical protein